MIFKNARTLLVFSLVFFGSTRTFAQPCVCGDLNGSGGPIDMRAFAVLQRCAGSGIAPGCGSATFGCSDLNADNVVDGFDFQIFIALMGNPPSGSPPTCIGSSPILSNLVVPPSVVLGELFSINLDFSDADGDIILLEFTRTDITGSPVGVIPSSLVPVNGTTGQISIPMAPESLAIGPLGLALRVRDRLGYWSNTLTATVQVVGNGAGGTAPLVSNFAPIFSSIDRPALGSSTAVRFQFVYSDTENDIVYAQVRFLRPGAPLETVVIPAAQLSISGPSGVSSALEISLSPQSALGTYAADLQLFDAAGQASAVASASTAVVANGGVAGASEILSFDPPMGQAGTLVSVSGVHFEDLESVRINEVFVNVIDANPSMLVIEVPPRCGTGLIDIVTAAGRSVSATPFIVPEVLSIEPATAQLSVLRTQQFEVIFAANVPAVPVTWSVNGLIGGSSEVGTISQSGLYSAPATLPPAGSVTIRAQRADNSAVMGDALMNILPPTAVPGEALILADVGGTIVATNGDAAVHIPPGAMSANAVVGVQTIQLSSLPPPAAGYAHVAAASFGPGGAIFASPVTITFSLRQDYAPGTTLPVRQLVDTQYIDEGVVATVTSSGQSATAQVHHFSNYLIEDNRINIDISPSCLVPSPQVVSFEPGLPLIEGYDVPIRIIGHNLTRDLVPTVLLNGVPSSDIEPGPVFLHADHAGLMLHIRTIHDLPDQLAQATREYTLRLTRFPPCAFVDIPFIVTGLDEKIVPLGVTEIWSQPAQVPIYSEVSIDGELVVNQSASPGFTIHATGPVSIRGRIDAEGARGENGNRQFGGAGAGFAGHGGYGRRDNGCIFSGRCAEPENFGRHFFSVYCAGRPDEVQLPCLLGTTPPSGPRSMGGFAGENDGEDGLGILASCIFGGPSACAGSIGTAITNAIDTLTSDDLYGGNGFGGTATISYALAPPPHGAMAGGGGGGGGARYAIGWGAVGTGAFFTGGGGGGGGSGGAPISILTPDPVFIEGTIDGHGGAGGDGSSESELEIRVVGAIVDTFELPDAARGGAGGGGRGSAISIVSGSLFGDSDRVDIRGGSGGSGALFVYDDAVGTRKYINGRPLMSKGSAGTINVAAPIGVESQQAFQPVFVPHSLLGEPLTVSMITNQTTMGVYINSPVNNVPVNVVDEAGVVTSFVATGATGYRHVEVTLPFGFSTLTIPAISGFPAMDPLLTKRVLRLDGDCDADGLTDLAETALGTGTCNPDTDGDCLTDLYESLAPGMDPLVPDNRDCDCSGMRDSCELSSQSDVNNDGILDTCQCATKQWTSNMFPALGVIGKVNCFKVYDDGSGPALFAGGQFDIAGDVNATNIAKWDGQRWHSLGSTQMTSGEVLALEVYGGELIVGGTILDAGGIATADFIVRWNGANWATFPAVPAGVVRALQVFNGDLIVGGTFNDLAGISTADYVARWNGAWGALGTGVNNTVNALTQYGSDLIAGGTFTGAGGAPADRVARWNGANWAQLGTPANNGVGNEVRSLHPYNGNLYVGGIFSFAAGGTVAAQGIAQWNGAAWTGMSSTGISSALTIGNFNGVLVVGGNLNIVVGGDVAAYVAGWNGTWGTIGEGVDANVLAVCTFNNDLYIGGVFTSRREPAFTNDSQPLGAVARLPFAGWSPLQDGFDNPGQGTLNAVEALYEYNGSLIAAGSFTSSPAGHTLRIARYDGCGWEPFGLSGFRSSEGVGVKALMSHGGSLYAGGSFQSVDGVGALNIAKWNGSAWVEFFTGTNSAVHALASYGSDLYAAGDFSMAGAAACSRIARRSGADWIGLAGGLNGTGRAMTVWDGKLVVGGDFTTANFATANRIAVWDGNNWSSLGSGMDGTVYAVHVHNGDLYAAGGFSNAGGSPNRRISRWNASTTSWLPVGSAFAIASGPIRALTSYQGDLIATGQFVTPAGPGNNIALWNGTAWAPFDVGLGNPVVAGGVPVGGYSLAVYDDSSDGDPELYVGGNFVRAGNQPSDAMARWGCPR